jgi:hypothetical protein
LALHVAIHYESGRRLRPTYWEDFSQPAGEASTAIAALLGSAVYAVLNPKEEGVLA